MTPYGSGVFFYILFIICLPAVILGFMGKRIRLYGIIATIIMLFVITKDFEELKRLCLFTVFSQLCVIAYSYLGKFREKAYVFYLFLLVMLMPLIISRTSWGSSIVIFMGISYVTFRTIQFLWEIREGRLQKVNILSFTYFTLFFPAISGGPIDRYKRFANQNKEALAPEKYVELLREGIWKIMNGVLYSFVLAPIVNIKALLPFDNMSGIWGVIGYMYAYTFYLFFNFAGYSKIAIGVGYIFGEKMPENFNMPFLSRDMKDFWNRWHMSLSSFFRDYIYSRFVAFSIKKKLFKDIRVSSYIGYILTMFTMGIWHGFSLNYLLYGLYHGVLLCINEFMDMKIPAFKKFKRSGAGAVICVILTFHIFAFGLLLFSGKFPATA